ncbi:MAG: serine/threonine protein kinase [Planctomycetes bacterium]|nr:serine/threonine protein kinase [Planctomycetota bacterium]
MSPSAHDPDGTLADAGIVNDLLAAILADQAAGHMGTLADYQARFAGHDATVAREFAALLGDDPAAALPTIPQVEIEALIGRGGQGAVYRGRQTWIDRVVAVKVLTPTFVHPQFTERFRREARTLASLTHPHIVACHQAGITEGGLCFLVMELVDGPDLRRHIASHGPLPPPQALQLTRSLIAALAHAQGHGIVHRDVKPENVLLAPRADAAAGELPFVAKLADLGLARPMTLQHRVTMATPAGTILGTPSTMAPEQFDTPERVDHRADIYGLGCVLFFALTGKAAFAGDSMTSLMAIKAIATGPDPRTHMPALPAPLAAVVQTMLARDPAQRPQTYRELDERLAALPAASPPSVPTTSRRGWLLGAGAIVTVFVGVIVTLDRRAAPAPAAPSFRLEAPTEITAGTSASLRVHGVAPGDRIAWRQTSGPIAALTGGETARATFAVPHGGAGARLEFTIEVTNGDGASPWQDRARILVVADARTPRLTAGARLPVFADGEQPTAAFLEPGKGWSFDELTQAPSVANRIGEATATTLVPGGAWELRGQIVPRPMRDGSPTPGMFLRIALGDTLALQIELSSDSVAPHWHYVAEGQTLRRTDPTANWEVRETNTLIHGEWQMERPLAVIVRWQNNQLEAEYEGAGQSTRLALLPEVWGVTWPPGTLTFGVDGGLACFPNWTFVGL